MTNNRVVVVDFINDALDAERDVLRGCASVEALDAHSEHELAGQIADAGAVMVYHHVGLTEITISQLGNCKLIVRCGVGYDNVDIQFARQQGIPVANIPDYGAEEVADSAIGMALSLTRGIAFHNSKSRRSTGNWQYTQAAPLYRLRGRVFGIVGLGRIGTATAIRAHSLGMNVVFYDPYKPDGYDKSLGIRRAESLDDLLAKAYVVSIHCPLTKETRHMINAETLSLMGDGSYLVNTARGGVVDVLAVTDAIETGKLAGAGLDVLEEEPPREDHPLLVAWRDVDHPAYDRVILNPHAAFYCEEGLTEMRVKGAEACRRALLGLPLRNIVN